MIEKSVQGGLNTALDFLKQGELKQAYAELEKILKNDLENIDIEYALRGVRFWEDIFEKAKQASTPLEQGEYMISQWKSFLAYIRKHGEPKEAVIYALKYAVFVIALKFYSPLFREETELKSAEPYRKVGLCYKALGDYEKSLDFLKYAADMEKNSAAVLAELADCYALYGEIQFSKVFFREAFFIDPSDIELQFLESEVICRLIRKIENLGYKSGAVAEWVPIYGVLDGIFNVKRELRSFEFGRLKQKIFLLESEIREKADEDGGVLVPRLINHYFWLIDHYVNIKEDKAKIDDVLLRIKVLDKNIYNSYVK